MTESDPFPDDNLDDLPAIEIPLDDPEEAGRLLGLHFDEDQIEQLYQAALAACDEQGAEGEP